MRLTRVKTYRKDGPPIEVKISSSSSYLEVAEIGSVKLGIDIDIDDGRWSLFHPDGTIIPDELEWTLGGYMSQSKKAPSQLKLGVGIVYDVCMPLIILV